MSLRRLYHRHVAHRGRFYVAVLLTIVAVAWIAVPLVVDFVQTVGSYDPSVYEPKDIQRGEYLATRGRISLDDLTWDNILKVALFIFSALAWMAVAPAMHRPGRSPRR